MQASANEQACLSRSTRQWPTSSRPTMESGRMLLISWDWQPRGRSAQKTSSVTLSQHKNFSTTMLTKAKKWWPRTTTSDRLDFRRPKASTSTHDKRSSQQLWAWLS